MKMCVCVCVCVCVCPWSCLGVFAVATVAVWCSAIVTFSLLFFKV